MSLILDQTSHLRESYRSEKGLLIKKFFDISVASFLLLILSPVLGGIALVLWATIGGPVFFRQTRSGFLGRSFQIIKFRTMNEKRDSSGQLLPDEVRLTTIGRFLRATSLDELPELWNVVRGELSLVGPRPLLVQYQERYSPEQARRLCVMPGVTGWAQVNGRNDLSWEEKFALDVWYVDHRCLSLDFRIFMRTIWQVLRRDGISRSGHATTTEFLGTRSCDEAEHH